MRKPLVVYVSGAPGSGKTTLAQKISQELYIPQISSDLIHAGVRRTVGTPIDRKKSLHEVFVPHLLYLANAGVSYVVDQVLQKDLSEQQIIAPLKEAAKVIYIHTVASDSIDRQLTRELARTDRGKYLDANELKQMTEFHRSNLSRTEGPLELDTPTLTVTTDDGYDPAIEHILDFIEEAYNNEGEN